MQSNITQHDEIVQFNSKHGEMICKTLKYMLVKLPNKRIGLSMSPLISKRLGMLVNAAFDVSSSSAIFSNSVNKFLQ